MTCEHINEGKNKFFTNLQTDMVWSFNSEYATFYKKIEDLQLLHFLWNMAPYFTKHFSTPNLLLNPGEVLDMCHG